MIGFAILRKARELSQEDVGRAVGLRQKTVSDFERGLRPSPGSLAKLASFYGVPEQAAARLLRDVPADVITRAVLEHAQ